MPPTVHLRMQRAEKKVYQEKKKIFDLLEGGMYEMVTPNAERARQTRFSP